MEKRKQDSTVQDNVKQHLIIESKVSNSNLKSKLENDTKIRFNSVESYMNFNRETNNGFIYANCGECGSEIKLVKNICKKNGNQYRVSRSIDCYSCGEKFNIIKNDQEINMIQVENDEKIDS